MRLRFIILMISSMGATANNYAVCVPEAHMQYTTPKYAQSTMAHAFQWHAAKLMCTRMMLNSYQAICVVVSGGVW